MSPLAEDFSTNTHYTDNDQKQIKHLWLSTQTSIMGSSQAGGHEVVAILQLLTKAKLRIKLEANKSIFSPFVWHFLLKQNHMLKFNISIIGQKCGK